MINEKLFNLKRYWYQFNDYKKDDYREALNREDISIDKYYKDDNMIALNISMYNDLNKYEIIRIVEDLGNIGIEQIAMLGSTKSPTEWVKDLKNNY